MYEINGTCDTPGFKKKTRTASYFHPRVYNAVFWETLSGGRAETYVKRKEYHQVMSLKSLLESKGRSALPCPSCP
jgi:hypothetical protein